MSTPDRWNTEDSAPDAPAGYREGYEPVQARSWLEYLPGEVGLFIGTVGLFGGLTTLVRDGSAVFGVFWDVLLLESVGVYLLLIVTAGLTVVAHEVIHGLAGHVAGCEVSFQRRRMSVGTRLRGGFLTRRADVLVTLAPAVVLTVLGLPLLVVVDSALAAAIVLTGLVANAAGVGSDLADVLALREHPPGTLLTILRTASSCMSRRLRADSCCCVRDHSEWSACRCSGVEAPSTEGCPPIRA